MNQHELNLFGELDSYSMIDITKILNISYSGSVCKLGQWPVIDSTQLGKCILIILNCGR